MRKITIILGCMIFAVGMMNGQSYSELSPGTTTAQQSTSTTTITGQQRTAALTTFDDRADFESAYSGTLIDENFDGGPGAGQIVTCGNIVSSVGDGCFPSGELEAGFEVTANSGGDVIYIGAGAVGNLSTLIGANTFADNTILTFSPEGVYAVGFDLFVSDMDNAEVTVFGTDGNVLEIYTVTNTPNTENFFGIISDVAIGEIEMNGEGGAGELFGNLVYGFDALGVKDNSLAGFSFYPNPTNGLVQLNADKNIQSVTLFNLLGQKIFSVTNAATVSEINLEGLATGTYIMEVSIAGKTGTYKINRR